MGGAGGAFEGGVGLEVEVPVSGLVDDFGVDDLEKGGLVGWGCGVEVRKSKD